MPFRKLRGLTAAGLIATAAIASDPQEAQAGMDPFIGEIMMVGYNFCPRGWTEANGQLLAISSNTALFSLYGTTYGGDGRTTFALPDLRGRVPMHTGRGPGLSDQRLGAKGGSETNTLNVTQLPPHSHSLNALSTGATGGAPAGGVLADTGRDSIYSNSASPDTSLNSASIGNAGGGQPVNNMQPYQVIRFCVALQGIFPSRN